MIRDTGNLEIPGDPRECLTAVKDNIAERCGGLKTQKEPNTKGVKILKGKKTGCRKFLEEFVCEHP